MSQSIFTSEVPSLADANDFTRYTLATLWTPSVNGQVTHGRWYFPVTQPSRPPVFALFQWTSDTSGTQLGSTATFSLASYAPGWRTVALASPVAVTAGSYYYAAVKTEDRYVASSGLLSSAVVNGQLTASANDQVIPRRNGRFNDFGAVDVPDYPDQPTSGGGACYFADVMFEPAAVGGGIVTRPFSGTVTRPNTGTVARPFTGVVVRP